MRQTSEVLKDFSFTNPINCYFAVDKEGKVEQLPHKNVGDRERVIQAIPKAMSGDQTIYVTWAGRWRTDLFIVDTLEEMYKAFIRV